ncbi:MAG: folylpolyglutamate synthase/dihydrofolate synthase family protein [Eubacteriales bacterium]|nr:folylpolyglutamate synthase/dihydrofolate synthase family protein [Eubacteriales bacterium]
MTYREAVDYIEEIPKFTKKHTLDHTKEFLKALGSPEKGQKIIHVAGTNGKGSVCAYMQAMLMAEGKRVGFFTSPHLVKINERISLNGTPIDDDMFLDIFCKVKSRVDEMGEAGFAHPSYFEFLFGMGMAAFREMNPDYIILETGLGGRLDATNAVEEPVLTVITSISLDHTQYLGNTIADIAGEKAGIIKSGVPLIFDGSSKEASEVLKKQTEIRGSHCREITNRAFEIREITDKHIAFSRVNAYDDNIVWNLKGAGIYQAMNASIAIGAMEQLADWPVERKRYELWREALSAVTWEGRMEEVLSGVYLDGAHNPGAIEVFCESVRALGESQKEEELPVILFSAVADKEYESMIAYLCSHIPAKAYVVTEVEDKRRVPAGRLKEVFEQYTNQPVFAGRDLAEAWETAISLKEAQGRMYCLGSLYLVGMVKNRILGNGEGV